MNRQKTQLHRLEADLTAHSSDRDQLLMVALTAAEASEPQPRTPLKIALVIDRSGSMSGEKIAITKAAVAQFIRSLDPDDRLALVTYDDRVDIVCGLAAPSEQLARRVELIEPGNSTDLYGGWVTGAKIVGDGGRVILLSDGLANTGRYTDADSLSRHAALSYERYGVITTTIGVGQDYDEALMAGMARSGGGAHYFAHTAQSIVEAFSQERYSAGAVALGHVTVRCDGITESFGQFWAGESKKRVFRIHDLAGLKVTIRYTDREDGKTRTEECIVPPEFGYAEEVRLEYLLQRASDAEGDMLRVRNPRSAGEMRDRLRGIVLELLAHPSSDEPAVKAVADRLKASIDRLEALQRNYQESEAMMHRKRSMQSSYNLREPAKAFSSFEEDALFVRHRVAAAAPSAAPALDLTVNGSAFRLAPLDKWIEWKAIPLDVQGGHIVVALEDPRRGFVVKEIERHTGMLVRPVFAGVDSVEIERRLRG